MCSKYIEKIGIFSNGIVDIEKPKRKDLKDIFFSGIFSFIGIFTVIVIEHHTDFLMVVASFGASAVLLYDYIDTPLAQPRNAFGGHLVSSLIGVSLNKLFILSQADYYYKPLVGALSVSLSIIIMGLTKTSHPPGAASALIAVMGPKSILDKGYMYVIHPISTGILIMIFIAVVFNNFVSKRVYPKYWV